VCQLGAIQFNPLTARAEDRDFLAVLFGDTTGNWAPMAAAASVPRGGASRVRFGPLLPASGRRALLPVFLDGRAAARALEVEIRYDPARLEVRRVRRGRQAAGSLLHFHAPEKGRLRLALAAPRPVRGGRQPLLVVDFRRGAAGLDDAWLGGFEVTIDDRAVSFQRVKR
jgi:hypothetical protein